MTRPAQLTHQELVEVLTDILTSVHMGDSLEGHITYTLADTPGDPDSEGKWDVHARYRIGNRDGQGGYRVVGDLLDG